MDTNNPPEVASENTLREQLFDIQTDHWLEGSSENLGQYKARYKCYCGLELIEDGHSDDIHKANIWIMLNDHITDLAMQAFTVAMETGLRAVRDFKPKMLPKSSMNIEATKQGINFFHRQLYKFIDKRLAEMVGKTKEGENI